MNVVGTRTATAVLASLLALSLAPSMPATAEQRAVTQHVAPDKLRGGLERLVRLGRQPDQALDHLVPGFRTGDFVVFAMLRDAPVRRVAQIRRTGARVRWVFRSIDAVSLHATRAQLLDLARQDWVRYLYPVRSVRPDASHPVSGSITRGDAPHRHDFPVPVGSKSITVALTVAPPTAPTFDFNLTDYLEARLVEPGGRVVMTRPSTLAQITFQYGEEQLRSGTWRLEIWYRNANQPLAATPYQYQGDVSVEEVPADRDQAPALPDAKCTSQRQVDYWRRHPNLPRRGVSDLGAPQLWARGIRGRGVRVAVIDTGTDASHVELARQEFEHPGDASCPAKVVADSLFFAGQRAPGLGRIDTDGHGTHVASEIAGNAAGNPDLADTRGAYPGVAPEASLIAARALPALTGLNDDILAAQEWSVIDQRADVTNSSYGIDVRYGVLNDPHDPVALGYEALVTNPAWGHPTAVVAAGNSGDIFNSIGSPASAPHVLTVAAAVKDYDLVGSGQREDAGARTRAVPDAGSKVHPSITIFSSRGPTSDLGFAPDIAAPGRYIVAANSNQDVSDPEQNNYWSASGTSMAAPHAAGSAALLVDAYRRAFGTRGRFGGRPPYWLVHAAMSNTAGSPAVRRPNVSYAGGSEGLRLYSEVGSREAARKPQPPVGPLVEGGGRINLPAAADALTHGVLAYTAAARPNNPRRHELQPSFESGAVGRGEAVTRQLVLHPATRHGYDVSLRAVPGAASINTRTIPPSWWRFPRAVSLRAGRDARVPLSLRVPRNALPGYYTGYLMVTARDRTTRRSFPLRIPALVVVEATDLDPGAGARHRVEVRGTAGALQPSEFPGNPGLMTGASSDFWLYPIDVRDERTGDIDLSLGGGGEPGDDQWDLFVYDSKGMVIAETYTAPPSAEASLALRDLKPGSYRVAVSLTYPADGGSTVEGVTRDVPYRLVVDMVGAAGAAPAADAAPIARQRALASRVASARTGDVALLMSLLALLLLGLVPGHKVPIGRR